jgi:hypothetical protein
MRTCLDPAGALYPEASVWILDKKMLMDQASRWAALLLLLLLLCMGIDALKCRCACCQHFNSTCTTGAMNKGVPCMRWRLLYLLSSLYCRLLLFDCLCAAGLVAYAALTHSLSCSAADVLKCQRHGASMPALTVVSLVVPDQQCTALHAQALPCLLCVCLPCSVQAVRCCVSCIL